MKELSPPQPHRRWPRRYRWAVLAVAGISVVAAGTLVFFYMQYARLIEEKLGAGGMQTNSTVYSAPRPLYVGQEISPAVIASQLQRSGYTESTANNIGYYRQSAEGLEIGTGQGSYFQPHVAVIQFADGKVSRIYSRTNDTQTEAYALEPELITNVFDESREKRRHVAFSELPTHLVHSILAVEDKRFFNHGGVDILRLGKAVYVDLKEGRKEQGASTLTMQLARSFWLDQEKTWKRKFIEFLLTAELERRFTKEQIFAFYASEIYLGRRGSFSIHGFGEAAQAYFNKDIRDLTLPESALLAAVIQRPGYYNPLRFPDRVRARRNLVLTLMRNNGYITDAQLAAASATPVQLRAGEMESKEAPFFVELVNDELQSRFQDQDFASNSFRVYTTLDLDLQRAAVEAVNVGMKEVDAALRKKRRGKPGPSPQVALVVLDPHTGALKALVGGRSYADSQLNRVLAKRQPGSSFKPFVYAAALNTAVTKKAKAILTAATVLHDEPTTFMFNRKPYNPGNFHEQYFGDVTLRRALMKSLNIPTVQLAQRVGYGAVVDLATRAGVESNLQPTPSLALGAYEMTPLEVADAYTIFGNQGVHARRHWISSIRDRKNANVFTHQVQHRQVLDQRIAYMMVNMMEDVVCCGTAASVRSRGFKLPAAGKTGTSRDGWFAGFTSKLLCVVWVGYDDNSELELEGSKSALPVWAEFMKRAHGYKEYADAQRFKAPPGLTRADICIESGGLGGPHCENVRSELFVAGTQPGEECELHVEGYVETEFRETSESGKKEKKGFFGRALGVFR